MKRKMKKLEERYEKSRIWDMKKRGERGYPD